MLDQMMDMPNTERCLYRILDRRECKKQYSVRSKLYPRLAEETPRKFNEILSKNNAWRCHGLAFRMATWSKKSEIVFERLENLLQSASLQEGWESEASKHLNWAKDYDQFFHRLWMLQSMEYFVQQGFAVAFPATKKGKGPDLRVSRGGEELYVECYFYSKWWIMEAFIEDILALTDPDVYLERKYNLSVRNFSSRLKQSLEGICEKLMSRELRLAKENAAKEYPVELYDGRDFQLLVQGDGNYKPNSLNAHGDAALSARVYLNEIIEHKESQNDLSNCHPNCLFVNALGTDFQMIFGNSRVNTLDCRSTTIDSVLLSRCGVDQKLACVQGRLCLTCEGRS